MRWNEARDVPFGSYPAPKPVATSPAPQRRAAVRQATPEMLLRSQLRLVQPETPASEPAPSRIAWRRLDTLYSAVILLLGAYLWWLGI